MLECALYLVVWAIVAAVLLWAAQAVLGAFGVAIPARIVTLVQVLVVLLVLIYTLGCLGFLPASGAIPWRRCP